MRLVGLFTLNHNHDYSVDFFCRLGPSFVAMSSLFGTSQSSQSQESTSQNLIPQPPVAAASSATKKTLESQRLGLTASQELMPPPLELSVRPPDTTPSGSIATGTNILELLSAVSGLVPTPPGSPTRNNSTVTALSGPSSSAAQSPTPAKWNLDDYKGTQGMSAWSCLRSVQRNKTPRPPKPPLDPMDFSSIWSHRKTIYDEHPEVLVPPRIIRIPPGVSVRPKPLRRGKRGQTSAPVVQIQNPVVQVQNPVVQTQNPAAQGPAKPQRLQRVQTFVNITCEPVDAEKPSDVSLQQTVTIAPKQLVDVPVESADQSVVVSRQKSVTTAPEQPNNVSAEQSVAVSPEQPVAAPRRVRNGLPLQRHKTHLDLGIISQPLRGIKDKENIQQWHQAYQMHVAVSQRDRKRLKALGQTPSTINSPVPKVGNGCCESTSGRKKRVRDAEDEGEGVPVRKSARIAEREATRKLALQ
ncbi:hypothetical protein C8J56DRAFT_10177 [Mycena floridula]|nr:hypothetical protein C8J56DRAFT_10177 [Mycena floridula]